MTVIMLAAGTSSRMGDQNKMLLSYKGRPMVTHCCMQALKYLNTLEKEAHKEIIVTTGYMKEEVEKALRPCVEYAKSKEINFTFAYNENYTQGQYSSTVCAVSRLKENEDFYINLSDMPLLEPSNYSVLEPFLNGYDAVRPFVQDKNGENKPGHPVLMSRRLKKAILQNPEIGSVNRLLKKYKVHECLFEDPSWTFDVDNPQVYANLI